MGEVLSQGEVDALLRGVGDGEVATETDEAPDEEAPAEEAPGDEAPAEDESKDKKED